MELAIVGGLLVLVIAATATILSGASRILQRTMLQTSADQNAVKSVNRMIQDIREAKQVSILAANHIRIYYPVAVSSSQYDRTRLDSTHYVDYAETNKTGVLTTGGGYLWRSTDSSAGFATASNLTQFTVISFAASAVELTVKVDKGSGLYHGVTTLNQKVIYMRNY